MSEFREADARLAGMHGYAAVDSGLPSRIMQLIKALTDADGVIHGEWWPVQPCWRETPNA